jgi:nitroimidazol reductase NimA-like FMN-containing flavoprotein (pyridoxamine 5'-phosphate oxidase superfamily)
MVSPKCSATRRAAILAPKTPRLVRCDPDAVTMLIHELTPHECAEVLNRTNLGRLGCARFDQPYIVPIHFSFDAERFCLYAFSTVGQKIDWMRANPKVCVETEEIVDKSHWTTVLVIGRYEEIQHSAEEAEARRRAEHLFQQRHEWWLPGVGKLASREHDQVVLYRIQVDRMTGRRAVHSPA